MFRRKSASLFVFSFQISLGKHQFWIIAKVIYEVVSWFEFGKSSFLRTMKKDKSAVGEGNGLALVGHLDHEALQKYKGLYGPEVDAIWSNTRTVSSHSKWDEKKFTGYNFRKQCRGID